MTYSRRTFLAGLPALWMLPALAAVEAPVRFGIVPYLTPRRLVTLYRPMSGLVERTLGRPVELSSAPGYASHLERLRAGEYDLAADSLPIARIAERELGHLPLARTRVPLQPVLIAARARPLARTAALRGGSVVVSDRLAALTLIGFRYLRDQGLVPGRDVRIVVAGTHANAFSRLLAGEADAAVVSRTAMRQTAPALVERTMVVTELPAALAAVVYHAAPRLAAEAPRLAAAMIDFAENTPEGRTFIGDLGHGGLLPVGAELATADPLVTEFYRQMSVRDDR